MGKVIIEFDSVEEQDDINMALNGYKYSVILHTLDNDLRGITKYGVYKNRDATEQEMDLAQDLRDSIRSYLSEFNLSLI
jgi:hypothetical protein